MWAEANIWLSTGATVKTHRVTHCCTNRVRKSEKCDNKMKSVRYLLLLQGWGLNTSDKCRLHRQLKISTQPLGSVLDFLELLLLLLLAAELTCRDETCRSSPAVSSHPVLLSEPHGSKFRTIKREFCIHSPRTMDHAGVHNGDYPVLPVLHVGPYHPGLHWQVSGARHSPPFSQCLLQTTAIQADKENNVKNIYIKK